MHYGDVMKAQNIEPHTMTLEAWAAWLLSFWGPKYDHYATTEQIQDALTGKLPELRPNSEKICDGRMNPLHMHEFYVCRAWEENQDVRPEVLERYRHRWCFTAANNRRKLEQARETKRIKVEDAPDVDADTVEWEPVFRRPGAGWSEMQICRTWAKGRYIEMRTDFPSPFDVGAEIVEKYTVFVGREHREIPNGDVHEDQDGAEQYGWWVTFETLEHALEFAINDVEAPRHDYLPLTVEGHEIPRVAKPHRKQMPNMQRKQLTIV